MSATTRRAVLRGTTAGLAGILLAQIPDAIAEPNDAPLVAAYQRLLSVQAELDQFKAGQVDDEEQTEPDVQQLHGQIIEASEAVEDVLPPLTLAGAVAVARAALATAEGGPGGGLYGGYEFAERSAFSVLEFLMPSLGVG